MTRNLTRQIEQEFKTTYSQTNKRMANIGTAGASGGRAHRLQGGTGSN